jgi:ethanolamine utilization microcompartment shell protein EutS
LNERTLYQVQRGYYRRTAPAVVYPCRITSTSPNPVSKAAGLVTVTVTGTGFYAGQYATVTAGAFVNSVTFVSATSCTVVLDVSTSTVGTALLTLLDYLGGPVVSNSYMFNIAP